MFDYIMLEVKDLNLSKRFYSAALGAAWLQRAVRRGRNSLVFGPKDAPALCLAKGGTDRTLSMLHLWPITALP